MGFTFWSFLLALIFSGLFILGLSLFRKHVSLSGKHSALALIFVCLLCILRIFLSYDFSFSTGISIRGFYAVFSDFILATGPDFSDWLFSPWQIFLIIWGIGAIWTSAVFFHQYHSYNRDLRRLSLYRPDQVARVSAILFHDFKWNMICTVLCVPGIQMPGGLGLFHKKILLPDRAYSDKELYYILAHEYSHFHNGDLFLKFFVQICCCIFWWFPLIRILQKQISQAAEIRCDSTVTEHIPTAALPEYMEALVKILKQSSQSSKNSFYPMATLLESTSEETVMERFQILAQKNKKESFKMILFSIISVIFFSSSYLFLPIPEYDPPIDDIESDGGEYIDPDQSWLYMKDNSYYLVINGDEIEPISESDLSIFLAAGLTFKEESYHE